MNTNQDILWKYYQEELKQSVNHEISRSSITNLILIITGVIISIITYNNSVDNKDLPLTIFLIIIGIFGVVFNAKYYERFNFHYSRSREYRKLLEAQYSEINFNEARVFSDTLNKNKFRIITKIRLNWLWLILSFLISIFGLTLTLIILFK